MSDLRSFVRSILAFLGLRGIYSSKLKLRTRVREKLTSETEQTRVSKEGKLIMSKNYLVFIKDEFVSRGLEKHT